MENTKLAQIGDIITAEEFAFGRYESGFKGETYQINKKRILVDGRTTTQKVGTRYGDFEVGAYEPARGESLFVVEQANSQGGGTGHGGRDYYPNGWNIKARRLDEQGLYNPNGEMIEFYQTGSFIHMVEEVNIVGKLQPVFVNEEQLKTLGLEAKL